MGHIHMEHVKGKVLRIFIGGTTPYADNRGVAAIFRGTLELLCGTFSEYELRIYVWHTFPESIQRYCKNITTTRLAFNSNVKVQVISLKAPWWFKNRVIGTALELFHLFLAMILIRILMVFGVNLSPRIEILDKILASDFVVELNFGDVLTDTFYGRTVWLFNILRVGILRLSKKPLYMLPQSIGPFKFMINKALARIVLNGARLVAVREQYSLDCAMKLGIDKSKVRLVPDISFLVPLIPADKAAEILNSEGFSRKCNRPLIGILLSSLVLTFTDMRKRVFLRQLVNTIDRLIEEFNADVVFIPHVTSCDAGYFDCLRFSSLIKKMLRNKDHAIVLTKEYTVEELWGIIGLCDVIISMLTHPVIASLKLCIPTVAISYSHKTRGVMNLFGVEKYVLCYDDFDSNKIVKIVNELIKNGNNVKQQLKQRVYIFNTLLSCFRQEFSRDVTNILRHQER